MAVEDFGERVIGSKHLTEIRNNGGLTLADISDWDKAEREKFINLTQVFPTPNYQKMFESGCEREALYLLQQFRNSLAEYPQTEDTKTRKLNYDIQNPKYGDNPIFLQRELDEFIAKKQAIYIKGISEIKELFSDIKTLDDVISAIRKAQIICDKSEDKYVFATQETRDILYNFSVKQSKDELEIQKARLYSKVHGEKYLYREVDKLSDRFMIEQYVGDNISYYDNNGIICKNALEVKFIDSKSGSSACTWFCSKDGSNYNIDEWKKGNYVVIDKYNFQIISANIPTRNEAEKIILDIHEKETTANKKAKSSKSKSSVEYPEIKLSDVETIETTDFKNTFSPRGIAFGKSLTDNEKRSELSQIFKAFKDLAKVLEIDESQICFNGALSVTIAASESSLSSKYEPKRNLISLAHKTGAGFLAREWGHALDHFVAVQTESKEQYASSSREVNGLMYNLMNVIKYDSDHNTKFYNDAKCFDKSYSKVNGRCWASDEELFARAFACYIKDKLSPESSKYLCGHADQGEFVKPSRYEYFEVTDYNKAFPYPINAERERINRAMDSFIVKLKELGILKANSQQKNQNNYKEKVSAFAKKMTDIVNEAENIGAVEFLITDICTCINQYDTSCDFDYDTVIKNIVTSYESGDENYQYTKFSVIRNLNKMIEYVAEIQIDSCQKETLFSELENLLVTEQLKQQGKCDI